jgi:hypothetical protein
VVAFFFCNTFTIICNGDVCMIVINVNNLRMKYVFLFVVSTCLMALNCTKQDGATREFSKDQTGCADAWGYGATQEETAAKLSDYLTKKGVKVNVVSLKQTSNGAVCLACTCSTRYTFFVTADARFSDILRQEGFQ